MVTLYGLKTCDTCRSARQDLEKVGILVDFCDVRESPLGRDIVARFVDQFGEDLINRRSTTWRNLSEKARESTPSVLVKAYPTVMKRPVIEGNGVLTIGWDAASRVLHLG